MTIVVGYVPTPEGEAALTQAIAEARKTNTTLLVINSSKGDALVDNRYAQEDEIQSIEERLATQGSTTSSSSRSAAMTRQRRSWMPPRSTTPS